MVQVMVISANPRGRVHELKKRLCGWTCFERSMGWSQFIFDILFAFFSHFFRYWCLTMLVLDHFKWTFAAFRRRGCAGPLAGEAKGFCETFSTLETSVVKLGSSNMESLLIQPALPGFSRTAAFWTPCKAVRDGRFPTFCACHWRETTTHLWHRSQWFKCSYITRSCSVLQRCSFFVHDMYWHVLTTLCIHCRRMPRDPREKPKSLGLNGQHVLEA